MGQRAAVSDPTLTSLISITLLRIFVRIAPVGSKRRFFLSLKCCDERFKWKYWKGPACFFLNQLYLNMTYSYLGMGKPWPGHKSTAGSPAIKLFPSKRSLETLPAIFECGSEILYEPCFFFVYIV